MMRERLALSRFLLFVYAPTDSHLTHSLPTPRFLHTKTNRYVEEDGIIMPDAENTPVGIAVSQGGSSTIIPTTSSFTAGGDGACNDPKSFRVAIVDSGLQGNHPDLPCRNINSSNSNCIGTSIGINGQPWWAPGSRAWHGTHVFGTMAAVGNNGQGITSMVPDSDAAGICYLIVRVFDDTGNGQYASVLFQGINWAISEGANVINMSLSGGSTYTTGQATFNAANAAGILSVAAAGNGGRTSLRYPASYNHVISVAATDNSGYVCCRCRCQQQ
jgi:serine protease